MLSQDDVGRRVVVRRRLPDSRLTDILGELLELGASHLVVLTDRGEITVSLSDIIAAKVVPPRPVRYSEIATLERAMAEGSPAPESRWLGDWLLRTGSDWTNRANGALPLGDPGLPLDEAIQFVEDWYRNRQSIPRFTLPLPLAGSLDRRLAERGWTAYAPTAVMTADLAEPAGPPGVIITDRPDRDWLDMVTECGGAPPSGTASSLTGSRGTAFASLRLPGPAGELIGTGWAVVTGDWLGLSPVQVAADHRRRGYGTRLIAALASWGRQVGAGRAYVRVEEADEATVGLYEALGYIRHHRYVHRKPSE